MNFFNTGPNDYSPFFMNDQDRLNSDICMYRDVLKNMAIVTGFYFLCWLGFLGSGGVFIEARCLFREDLWLISTVFGVQLGIVSLFRCGALPLRHTLMSVAVAVFCVIFGVGMAAWGFCLTMAWLAFAALFFNGMVGFIGRGAAIALAILCFVFFMNRDLTEPLGRPTYTDRMTDKELYGEFPDMNWAVQISNSESSMTREERCFKGSRANAVLYGYSETNKLNEEARRKGLSIRYSFTDSDENVIVYDVSKERALAVGDSERAISADRVSKGLGRY